MNIDFTWRISLTEQQHILLPDGDWTRINLLIQKEITKKLLEKIEEEIQKYETETKLP